MIIATGSRSATNCRVNSREEKVVDAQPLLALVQVRMFSLISLVPVTGSLLAGLLAACRDQKCFPNFLLIDNGSGRSHDQPSRPASQHLAAT